MQAALKLFGHFVVLLVAVALLYAAYIALTNWSWIGV